MAPLKAHIALMPEFMNLQDLMREQRKHIAKLRGATDEMDAMISFSRQMVKRSRELLADFNSKKQRVPGPEAQPLG